MTNSADPTPGTTVSASRPAHPGTGCTFAEAPSGSAGDHRTPQWRAEFAAGKAEALAEAPGRAANIEQRLAQRDELYRMLAETRAASGPYPTDPRNHGRVAMLNELLEENTMA